MATKKKTTTKPKPLSCQDYEKWVKEVYIPWYKENGEISTQDSGGNPNNPPPPPPGSGNP